MSPVRFFGNKRREKNKETKDDEGITTAKGSGNNNSRRGDDASAAPGLSLHVAIVGGMSDQCPELHAYCSRDGALKWQMSRFLRCSSHLKANELDLRKIDETVCRRDEGTSRLPEDKHLGGLVFLLLKWVRRMCF